MNLVEQAAKDYDMTIEQIKKLIGDKHIFLDEFHARLETFVKNRDKQDAKI
jgi:hypothetical protein